jgi:hypothetical protein
MDVLKLIMRELRMRVETGCNKVEGRYDKYSEKNKSKN